MVQDHHDHSHEEHHENHEETHGEDEETYESYDWDKVFGELAVWFETQTDQTKYRHMLETVIHVTMTVGTGGIWLLGLVGYWAYKFKQHLDRHPEEFKKEFKNVEVE